VVTRRPRANAREHSRKPSLAEYLCEIPAIEAEDPFERIEIATCETGP
jgi:hypothetical protein